MTMQDLTCNFDNHITTDIVVLDFSKAFDVVPRNMLFQKLEHYRLGEVYSSGLKLFCQIDYKEYRPSNCKW